MFRFSYVNRIILILLGAFIGGAILKTLLIPESFENTAITGPTG